LLEKRRESVFHSIISALSALGVALFLRQCLSEFISKKIDADYLLLEERLNLALRNCFCAISLLFFDAEKALES
jgi:hypothetical protein